MNDFVLTWNACLGGLLFMALCQPQAQAQSAGRLDDKEDPCFLIRSVTLDTGGHALPSDVEKALSLDADGSTDSPIGQCVGATGIQRLIDRAQNALVAQGFVTSRVLAAPQNLRSGALTLTVLPGQVQHIEWAPHADGSLRRASSWNTVPASEGDMLNLRDVEQSLENFKRVPTADADIQIVPADEPGFSHLLINHSQPKFLRLNLTLDDSGTPSIGKQQASATLSYDNPLTLSDLFYFTVNQDTGVGKEPGSRGTHGKTWHYSIPFGYQLLTVNHSQSSYYQTVAGLNQDYVYAGTSESSDIKVSRVVQRDAAGKTTVGLKAFQRQSNNYIYGTEVEVQKRVVGGWVWDIAHKRSLGQASLDTTLSYKKGTGNFGSIAAPEEATNEGTSRMRIWNADSNISLPFTLAEKAFTYSLNWRYQLNKTRLTPQDRFSIGGRYTVRGFDGINSLTGDKGWVLRNELFTRLGADHTLYVGLDKGRVDGHSAENLLGRELTGAVIGLRAQHGILQYDIFIGGPLHMPDRFKTSSRTSGFNLSVSF